MAVEPVYHSARRLHGGEVEHWREVPDRDVKTGSRQLENNDKVLSMKDSLGCHLGLLYKEISIAVLKQWVPK